MIARFDHRPMLTAVLALTTTLLFVVVITLSTLLLMTAPPAATSSSESGANPGAAAAVPGTGDNLPQPAQAGNGAHAAIDRHAEVVAAYVDNR
jgi:hypothetical protein